MPIINSGQVLVTGATGFMAGWVIKTLLDHGYTVRGTARSAAKGEAMKKFFSESGDKLDIVIVEDMCKENAFDEAVQGVDAILHVSSPVRDESGDPKNISEPAVLGTVRILESALRHGSTVKRVVITSSCGAVHDPKPGVFSIFNENDWNDAVVQVVKEKGGEASGTDKYRASKVLAERAAWALMEQHKGETRFDMTVILPPGVFGPTLRFESPAGMAGSMRMWWSAVKGDYPDNMLKGFGGHWIDVRDNALAHVLALQKEELAGERVIVASLEPYKAVEWLAIAHKINPRLPAGEHDLDISKVVYDYKLDTSKGTKVFGIKLRTMEETCTDILAQLKD